jgi:hypothetical protein
MDFLDWLDHDTSMKILRCLEDPADLVRVSSVSRSWRHFGKYLVFILFRLNSFKHFASTETHCKNDCAL